MKNLVGLFCIVSVISNLVLASENSSDICRGEISSTTSIVDGANKCSETEINRSYTEIKILEDHVQKDISALQKLKEQSGRNKVSYNQVVFVETHYATAAWLSVGSGFISGTGYVMHGLTHGGKLFPNAHRVLKGSGILFAMSLVSGFAAKEEKSRLEIEFKDIPLLEKRLAAMSAEIELRKKAIEIAMKIKSLKNR